jgi:predicted nucleic acid-binding protein
VHIERTNIIFQKVFTGVLSAHVTPLVLAEVCGVMSRQVGTKLAEPVFLKLSNWLSRNLLKIVDENSDVAHLACKLAINHRLKGADALIAAAAQHYNLQLITFDEEIISKLKLKHSL